MDIFRKLCWKLIKAKLYPDLSRLRREVEKEASLSHAQWRAVQARRLSLLLEYARSTTPYYREALSGLSASLTVDNVEENLLKAPLLRRQTLQNHLEELVSENADRQSLVENATGGSTGEPVKFYQDLAYLQTAMALDEHVRSWIGLAPGDGVANIWGADRDLRDLGLKDQIYSWASGVKTLNAFRMKGEDMQAFYQLLAKWSPPYLMGYSSALEAFSLHCRDNGSAALRFKGIRSTAEVLWPHQQELIEEVFQSPVYNFYGSREINNIAAQCPEQRELHLFSTYRYVEVVDEAGQRLPPGEPGLLAITDLSNYAMPFIRYVNGDVGCLEPERVCACGRPSPLLSKLVGRSTDMIKLANGEFIHGEFFTHLFYGREDVEAFQVQQTSLEHLTIRLVLKSALKPEFAVDLERHVKEQMGEAVEVEIEECQHIPLLPSGKYRFTISDVN